MWVHEHQSPAQSRLCFNSGFGALFFNNRAKIVLMTHFVKAKIVIAFHYSIMITYIAHSNAKSSRCQFKVLQFS